MNQIKNGTVRLPIKDASKEDNWYTLRSLSFADIDKIKTDPIMKKSYIALNEVYVDGIWALVAFKKEEEWESERPFFLIKGKWYPSKGEWAKLSLSQKDLSSKMIVEEIHEIMKDSNEK